MSDQQNWKQIWERRTLDPKAPSRLAALMAADGLDTGFGSVSEQSWRAFVGGVADRLEIGPGRRVYEIGCGAGAFLLPLAERGAQVAGLDLSETLLGFAREAMPGGTFHHQEARQVDVNERFDIVVSCGVFLYFPSLDYAREVIQRTVKKATRAVALLDTADLAKRDAAMAHRRGHVGAEAYERRYRGLDHLFVDREWLSAELKAAGCSRVVCEDQRIDGYANAKFRFNAFGWI